uniref:Cilium assembly protein DZIP1 n=1 Tax=Geotrypetes seraphini TaxID=260995 RepID=A0A6P8RJF2_GEOSA|nr:zinc finger protein DZIP1 isoform X2 [Geotrypetes seraphini]
MPFYNNVYYPYGIEIGASFTSLSSSLSPHPIKLSSLVTARMPAGQLPVFKFRSRHETVDWRRISAIDVDRVANELDFITLQEHITNVTFCNVENERCPHCQNAVDPVLLKLLRLAQLTIEYLLHSQEYLTSSVHALEEKVQGSISQTEQIKVRVSQQAEEVKSLKDECKRRKKIISTQQIMIHAGANTYHKCQLCDKAFMNYSFLQSHVHRRHPEETAFEKQKVLQSDKLQSEIDKLKEELLLTKCHLEAEQSAHVAKLSQGYEHQKVKEDEILKKFDKWKEEEREKFGDEMNKVKEMFIKEFQELTSKNDVLEKHLIEIQKNNMQVTSNLGTLKDSQPYEFEEDRKNQQENLKEFLDKQERKWASRMQQLYQEHEREKNQCQLCDKAFMNYSFLQSHVHRRHPEETAFEKQKVLQSDKLQSEINKLKEELLLTKCHLEAEQSAHVAKLSQGYEHQKVKEDEILKKFDKWKEEEREKFGDEMNKVKEMFIKEFQELTSKNDVLEKHLIEIQKNNMQVTSNLGTLKDSQPYEFEEDRKNQQENLKEFLDKQERKWASRMQQLYQEHEREKTQIENLRSTMTEDQKESSIFYKKRIDELDRRLKEQSEIISSQKDQMTELSIKQLESVRRYTVSVPTVQHVESKPSASTTRVTVPTVLPVESKSSVPFTHEEEKTEVTPRTSKQRLINTLKHHPSLIKELRSVLEQGLVEKLESLGVKAGVRGIPSDHLNRILASVECQREEKKKEVPEIQQIREHLIHQMSMRLEKSSPSSGRLASTSQLFLEDRQKKVPLESLSSVSLPKAVKSRSKMKQFSEDAFSTEQRKATNERTSSSNRAKKKHHSNISKRASVIGTPPFSSEDELEEDISFHSNQIPKQLHLKSSTGNKSGPRMMSAQSDSELSDESETEGHDLNKFNQQNLQKEAPAKPIRGTIIKELQEQIEKKISSHGNEKKPVGGVDVTQVFKKDEVKELKLTDFDDDNWDISSLEEEKHLISKSEKALHGHALQKNDLSIQNKSGWVSTKLLKGEGRETDTTSTLKSSLVTVTDLSSDCLDI